MPVPCPSVLTRGMTNFPTRLFFLLALFFAPCAVRADSAKQCFMDLNNCLTQSPPAHCRTLMTSSSLELYDRLSTYDVIGCLPKKTEYLSEQPQGKYTLVRARTQLGNTPRFLKMAFVKEKDKWKLDIPYSLRMAIGENWQKQVNMTEQLYLFLRAQMKGKIDCTAVQNLAAGQNVRLRTRQN